MHRLIELRLMFSFLSLHSKAYRLSICCSVIPRRLSDLLLSDWLDTARNEAVATSLLFGIL